MQVTSLLLASGGDNTEAKDTLVQQAVLKNEKITLQSNEVTGLERDDLAALLQLDHTGADRQAVIGHSLCWNWVQSGDRGS